jgi:hypothetical protein
MRTKISLFKRIGHDTKHYKTMTVDGSPVEIWRYLRNGGFV